MVAFWLRKQRQFFGRNPKPVSTRNKLLSTYANRLDLPAKKHGPSFMTGLKEFKGKENNPMRNSIYLMFCNHRLVAGSLTL